MSSPITSDQQVFLDAEAALLASEGVPAAEVESLMLPMQRLGGELRVLAVGQGPPVVFLPGVMTTGAVFAGVVGRLQGLRCFLVDRPGTGLSSLPDEPSRAIAGQRRIGDDLLVDVLDALELETASAVFTSMGGWYGFRGAAQIPDRLQRIAGLAFQVGARITDAPFSMRLPPVPALMPRRPKLPPALVRGMLRVGGMSEAVHQDKVSPELIQYLRALIGRTDTLRNEMLYNPRPAKVLGPIRQTEHDPAMLAKITAPVHLVWGERDVFGDETSARSFAAALPNSSLRMIAGAGHAPWLDEPDLVAAEVQHHLDGSASGAT